MPQQMRIRINRTSGTVTAIYDDKLLPLFGRLGNAKITRVSNIEPTTDGKWRADLSIVGGPVLPATITRQESLTREIAWLEQNLNQVIGNIK